MSADELFEIRKKIASTEAKLKVAEEANDEVSIARLETLLTERLKKENFLLTSSASAGAHIVIFHPFICTTIQFCMFPLC